MIIYASNARAYFNTYDAPGTFTIASADRSDDVCDRDPSTCVIVKLTDADGVETTAVVSKAHLRGMVDSLE